DAAFLAEVGEVVVKTARGEQGAGITVGVRTPQALRTAVDLARRFCPDVLIEERRHGEDLRVVVIDHEVVAAAVRRPASVIGDGVHTIAELIERQSRRRAAATGAEARNPGHDITPNMAPGPRPPPDPVLPDGRAPAGRATTN